MKKIRLIIIGLFSFLILFISFLMNDAKAGGKCDNINGYKRWYTHGIRAQQFYDCCYVLREGYSPSGACSVQPE